MRKLALFFLTTLFVLLGTLGAVAWQLRASVLDFDFYKAEIEKYEVFPSAKEETVKQLYQQQKELAQAGSPVLFEQKEIEKFIATTLPTVWLRDQTNNVIDDFDDWLDSDEAEFNPSLDISKQKQNLTETIKDTLTEKEQNMPVCTFDQLLEIEKTGKVTFDCLPPGYSLEQFLGPEGYGFLDDFTSVLPDTITLKALIEGSLFVEDKLPPKATANNDLDQEFSEQTTAYRDFMSSLREFRNILTKIDFAFEIWAASLVSIVLLVLALTFRHSLSLAKWIGSTLLLLGIDFGTIYAFSLYAQDIIRSNLTRELPTDLDREIGDKILSFVIDLVQNFSQPFLMLATVCGLAGLCCLASVFVIRHRQTRAF